MKLLPILILLTLALPGAAHASSSASVRMVSCSWQDGGGGSVSYEARMRSVPGTSRMVVRFHLLQRVPSGEFEEVAADGQDVWRESRRGATEFRWLHKVKGLKQGGEYRVRVDYRWMTDNRTVIQSARRKSKRCSEPGGPPNLRVAGIETVLGAFDGTARYRVTVVNRGGSDARRVGVLLRVDGAVVDEAEPIETLRPGESRTLSFSGPLCRRSLSAEVDPKDAIAESQEDDNVRTAGCV